MVRVLLLFSFVVFVSTRAISAECGDVNLSDHFQKTYDQKDIGWCYAYSAADLVNFKYRDILKGKSVSPLHLALLQNFNLADKFNTEGGSVKETIRLATNPFHADDTTGFYQGTCLSVVDQKLAAYQPHRSIRQHFYQLSELKKKYDQASADKDLKSFLEYYAIIGKDNSPITYLDTGKLNILLASTNNRNIGIQYLNHFCPVAGRFVAPSPDYPIGYSVGDTITLGQKVGPSIVKPITKSAQILDEVHAQLDKSNVVSISYYSGFLTNALSNSRSGVFHASTVVGRQILKGQCHIIVRNSWGECFDYEGKSKYSKNVSQCKDGYLWISEKEMLKNLDGITFLK